MKDISHMNTNGNVKKGEEIGNKLFSMVSGVPLT
jgi:hypothetical protein